MLHEYRWNAGKKTSNTKLRTTITCRHVREANTDACNPKHCHLVRMSDHIYLSQLLFYVARIRRGRRPRTAGATSRATLAPRRLLLPALPRLRMRLRQRVRHHVRRNRKPLPHRKVTHAFQPRQHEGAYLRHNPVKKNVALLTVRHVRSMRDVLITYSPM